MHSFRIVSGPTKTPKPGLWISMTKVSFCPTDDSLRPCGQTFNSLNQYSPNNWLLIWRHVTRSSSASLAMCASFGVTVDCFTQTPACKEFPSVSLPELAVLPAQKSNILYQNENSPLLQATPNIDNCSWHFQPLIFHVKMANVIFFSKCT